MTESSLFSPNFIDHGTLAMLSVIDFLPKRNKHTYILLYMKLLPFHNNSFGKE